MHLIVVLEDRVSEWVAKGEILEGYFNPSGVFDKITVVGLVADKLDSAIIANLCKPAVCTYLNANLSRKRLALYRRRSLVSVLNKEVSSLMEQLGAGSANLVRGYGEGLAAVVSEIIASVLKIPFVVSIHQTADPKILDRHSSVRDRVWRRLIRLPVKQALLKADGIIAVYSPIVEYLPKAIASRTEVIPNVVGIKARPNIEAKYGNQLNVVCVGRQMPGRDPRPIIRAMAGQSQMKLTLVGTGSLHAAVIDEITRWNLQDRVHLVESMPNAALCESIKKYDVMAINSQFREISKSLIEAALSGVPIVINEKPASEIREFCKLPLVYTHNDSVSYGEVLTEFAKYPRKRYELGRITADAAWSVWNPERVGLKTAEYLLGIAASKR